MNLQSALESINQIPSLATHGYITAIHGLTAEAHSNIKGLSLGNRCEILCPDGATIPAEIIKISHSVLTIMLFRDAYKVGIGFKVSFNSEPFKIYPHDKWCGRVINAFANPIDDKGPLSKGDQGVDINSSPPNATMRTRLGGPIDVGVRSINTFLTTCKGQRMGIFSGSGVGKSMLLSMLAKYTKCDVCVIGMIGERGREVREFIEETLGTQGLAKSIMVVSTSDETPIMRKQGAKVTLSIAEYFRDQGKNVLCLLDSVTRFAMAQREIGLSAGEPPTAKGYTPSVFTEMAKLLERAGPGTKSGTITAYFTVLVDGDDHNEPVSDAARGILDGHIVLDRAIAQRGQFPAINILKSISRTMPHCQIEDHRLLTQEARKNIAIYEEMSDLIQLGAYQRGNNESIDHAIDLYPKIMGFLAQKPNDHTDYLAGFDQLSTILKPST